MRSKNGSFVAAVVFVLMAGCKVASPASRVASSDPVESPRGIAGFGLGGHDVLPPGPRTAALQKAGQIELAEASRKRNTANYALADADTTRHRCADPLEDVNCYWDACAAELGGNLADNYMLDGIDPRRADVGEVIKTFWNGKLIEWKELNGVWQFTFDGQPGGTDWPEKGANLRAPVLNPTDLRCDWADNGNFTTCIPGQKRIDIKRGDVRWMFLFRRMAPPQPNADVGSPLHPDFWGNIAVLAFRASDGDIPLSDGTKTKANAVCWINTFNKTMQMQPKKLPLPVPGGRFGTSQAEEERRNAVLDFWDTPGQHRTLTAYFGGSISNAEGENCVTCHGNGPILDAVWYREKGGVTSKDDRIPFFSAVGLHNPRTFWKVKGTCASCHKFMAQANTCNGLLAQYTSVPPASIHSGMRLGMENYEPGTPGEKTMPSDQAKMKVGSSVLMPDPLPDDEMTLEDYQRQFGADIEKITKCCNGQCDQPTFTVRAPKYFGAQEKTLPEGFIQRVPPPAPVEELRAEAGNCADGKCEMKIHWRDPASRFTAAERYAVVVGAEGGAGTEFCAGQQRGNVEAFPLEGEAGWRQRYEATVSVTCNAPQSVRVCGTGPVVAHGSTNEGQVLRLACA